MRAGYEGDREYGHESGLGRGLGSVRGSGFRQGSRYEGGARTEGSAETPGYQEVNEEEEPMITEHNRHQEQQTSRSVRNLKEAGITDKMLEEANMTLPKVNPSERELRPDDVGKCQFPSEFTCKLCDARCTSAVTFQSHLAGSKHKNNVEAAKKGTKIILKSRKKTRPSLISLDRTSKIEKLFESVTDCAVLGLEYLTEFQKLDPKAVTMCVCNLCESKVDENMVVSHIIGTKHKLNYMKEKHPNAFEHFKKFSGKKSQQSAFAEELARGAGGGGRERAGHHEGRPRTV
ncbi:uncharacterized protein LOC124259455 [Haliotis rubra]|uniref:uncharacterized protein LOC124259455 n=1 Tax=Haliotis rubra TaxID=36100 RepID=UPI001EE5377C|nr:uncharacterized protein LOC124259455 [Haliotis rubra]